MHRYVAFFGAGIVVLALGCDRAGPPSADDQGHHHNASHAADADSVQLTEAQAEFADIQVEEVGKESSQSLLKAMGKLLAAKPRTAIVSHAFSGRVAKLHVAIGEWVEEGQPLITLESHEVGDAKSEFYKAVADLELAKLNFEREEHLMEQEIGIRKNLVAAEAAFKIAQSTEEAAEKTLHVLGFDEEQVKEIAETHQISPQITLFAPIAGQIVANEAVLGALVDASTEILRVIDTSVLWADAQIYEKDIAKMRIGQKVDVTVPAYRDKVFHGEVSYIGSLVDEETRTITVRAEVGNPDALLKPGMFADIKVHLNGDSAMLVVPCEAILLDGGAKIVFVQDGESYRRREIETGALDGEKRQVLGGLEEGEKVVVLGNYQLRSVLMSEALEAGHTH
jgi:cobalt-zinc-cadmium efflux system membrane fusion protein